MSSSAERILVVESEPDISDLVAQQALGPLGYDVEVVGEAMRVRRLRRLSDGTSTPRIC